MAKNKYNLLKSYEWTGVFYTLDYEKRFAGHIRYSPKKGLKLMMIIPDREKLFFKNHTEFDSDFLYGILDDGQECTLYGDFSTRYLGYRGGESLNFHGFVHFQYLVLGGFLNEKNSLNNFSIKLTNLKHYFFHSKIKNLKKSIVNKKKGFEISIYKPEVHEIKIHEENDNWIYHPNKLASKKLHKVMDEIIKENNNMPFYYKQDTKFKLNLNFKKKGELSEAFKLIQQIANIYSLLSSKPVIPKFISATRIFDDEPHRNTEYILFSNRQINNQTLKLIKTYPYNFRMSLNGSSLDILQTINNWIPISKKYETIVPSFQFDTGWTDLHKLHGEIVVYSTHLEDINMILNGQNNRKYLNPIETYASDFTIRNLTEIFKKYDINDIGVGISKLRNDIAHVDSNQLLSKIDIKSLIKISRILRLVILSHIFKELEIDRKFIENYQYYTIVH